MEMALSAVTGAAAAWRDQQHDLTTAAQVLGTADTSGFPPAPARSARAFVDSWRRLVDDLAATAGAQATSLRATAGDWLATDGAVAETMTAHALRAGGRS